MKNEDLMFLKEQMRTNNAKLVALREELYADSRKKINEMVQSLLFEKYPELETFSWTQYTPYFNDGEDCEFDVNWEYPTINGYDDNYGEILVNGEEYDDFEDYTEKTGKVHLCELAEKRSWDNELRKSVDNPNFSQDAYDVIDSVKEFIRAIDEEILEQVFGDHVKVMAQRGVDLRVEKYDHE